MGTAASLCRRYSAAGPPQSPGPDDLGYLDRVRSLFPGYFEIDAAENRGITIDQLQQIFACAAAECPSWFDLRTGQALSPSSFNLYHLNGWLIMPCTKPRSCSFVELVANGVQTPAWFVSHWWGESVFAFIRCLQEHALQRLHHEISVALDFDAGAGLDFGLEYEQFDQRCLRITAIGPSGSVASWNTAFPDRAVRVGDFIVGASYVRPHEFPFQTVDNMRDILTAAGRVSGNTATTFDLRVRRLRVSPYWVCAYANRQHALGADVTVDPRESSFFRAMRLAQGLLLVLDDKTEATGPATPFTRIWCAFEAFVALDENEGREAPMLFDIVASCGAEVSVLASGTTESDDRAAESRTQGGHYFKTLREQRFPVEVVRRGLDLHLERAQASQEADRRHILNSLARRDELQGLLAGSGGADREKRERLFDLDPPEACPVYTKVNRCLGSKIAAAIYRQALEKGLVLSLDLPRAISCDEHLERLVLSFRGYRWMTDSDLAVLAKCLALSLRALELDLSYCSEVGDAGVAAVKLALPPGLQELKLLLHGTKSRHRGLLSLDEIRRWAHPKPAAAAPPPAASKGPASQSEPKNPSRQPKKDAPTAVKILMLGDSGAGKTELLRDFCRAGDGEPNFIGQIGVEFKIRFMELGGHKLKVQVWDTAGQERFRNISPAYLRGADGVAVVYSVSDPGSFRSVQGWISQADDHCSPDTQRILVGTWPDPAEAREVSTQEGQELAHRLGACFFEVAARDAGATDEAFECLVTWIVAQRNAPEPSPAR